jgi:hypothetical protein
VRLVNPAEQINFFNYRELTRYGPNSEEYDKPAEEPELAAIEHNNLMISLLGLAATTAQRDNDDRSPRECRNPTGISHRIMKACVVSPFGATLKTKLFLSFRCFSYLRRFGPAH